MWHAARDTVRGVPVLLLLLLLLHFRHLPRATRPSLLLFLRRLGAALAFLLLVVAALDCDGQRSCWWWWWWWRRRWSEEGNRRSGGAFSCGVLLGMAWWPPWGWAAAPTGSRQQLGGRSQQCSAVQCSAVQQRTSAAIMESLSASRSDAMVHGRRGARWHQVGSEAAAQCEYVNMYARPYKAPIAPRSTGCSLRDGGVVVWWVVVGTRSGRLGSEARLRWALELLVAGGAPRPANAEACGAAIAAANSPGLAPIHSYYRGRTYDVLRSPASAPWLPAPSPKLRTLVLSASSSPLSLSDPAAFRNGNTPEPHTTSTGKAGLSSETPAPAAELLAARATSS